MSDIRVNNYTDSKIEVSINHWGHGGDTSPYGIAAANGNVPGQDTWAREDPRGFIMAVDKDGEQGEAYYVTTDAMISLKSGSVEMNGNTIKPFGSIPADGGTSNFTLTVRNNTDAKIEASINKWGKKGDTSFFHVKPQDTEPWSRGDARGFVMALKRGDSSAKEYYVTRSSVIVVEKNEVTDRGTVISPVNG